MKRFVEKKFGQLGEGIIFALVTLALAVLLPLIYSLLSSSIRGPRTSLGLTLGILSLAFAYASSLYSVRRAYLQYHWGNIEMWLRVHTYAALLALIFALLHSDYNFRPGAASAALGLLFLTNLSGLAGWIIYVYAPPRIKKDDPDKIDSPEEIYGHIDKLQDKVESLGRRIEKSSDEQTEKKLSEEIAKHEEEIKYYQNELKMALRRENIIGAWMYFHIPISMAFIVTASVHAFVIYYLLY